MSRFPSSSASAYAILRPTTARVAVRSCGGPLRDSLLLAVVIATTAGAAPLDAPVHAVWSGLPLADWASRVSLLAGCPVILDRRIDPDVLVERECRGESLGAALAAVAATARGTPAVLDGIIRIAPPAQAAATSRAEAQRRREMAGLSAERRRSVAAREAWSWPAGARPRELIAEATARARLTVEGLDSIPHDHLPEASLPALALGERLDLVLAHYDLRVMWLAAGPAGRIVPLPRPPASDGDAGAAVRSPASRDPAVRRPPAALAAPGADMRFTMRIEAPLEDALRVIARQLGLELDLDRTALGDRGISPREIVRATVSEATREQLLDAVTRPPGLGWTIEGDRLVVAPTRASEPRAR